VRPRPKWEDDNWMCLISCDKVGVKMFISCDKVGVKMCISCDKVGVKMCISP